jgi:hypothetical protein
MFPAGATAARTHAPATVLVSAAVSLLALLINLVLISVGLLAPTTSG